MFQFKATPVSRRPRYLCWQSRCCNCSSCDRCRSCRATNAKSGRLCWHERREQGGSRTTRTTRRKTHGERRRRTFRNERQSYLTAERTRHGESRITRHGAPVGCCRNGATWWRRVSSHDERTKGKTNENERTSNLAVDLDDTSPPLPRHA